MKKLLLSLLLISMIGLKLSAQTTYYWVGGNGAAAVNTSTAKDWIPSNWNTSADGTGSQRTVSAGNDILIFDGNSPLLTVGNKNIFLRNVPRDSCGQLQIINGAFVNIQSNVSANSTVTGYTTIASNILMLNTASYGVAQGLPITGANIPAGTIVTSVAPQVNTTASSATTAGSATVTLTAGNPSIVPGVTVSGTGVTVGSVVLSATTPTVTYSTGATSTSATITLTAPNPAIVVGMGITGSGVPAGATVTAYDGNLTVTISAATTSTVAAANLTISTSQTLTLSSNATATGGPVTLTFLGTQLTLSQAATVTTTAGTPASFVFNADAGTGTFAMGSAYGGCVMPVTGTGASFSSFFRPGDYIMTANNYSTMSEVLNVTSDNDLTIASDYVTAPAAGVYNRAISLYIKGNPGLQVDATSTLGLGNTLSSSGFLNFVINLLPGATGTIYGNVSFQSRGTGSRIVAADPGALVFKAGSNCNIGISAAKVYLFGSAQGSGSAALGSFLFKSQLPSITFEAGANYKHSNVQAMSPFGVGINAATPLVFTPTVAFLPKSNYYFTYGNGYPPYFYTCNAVNYSPASAASYGNVIFNGTSIPAKSATASLFFLPARVDTLTISNTYTGTTAYSNYVNNTVAPPAYVYGTIINNSAAPLNFGKVMFMGSSATLGTGTTAPILTNLLVGDGATLTLNGNIFISGTASGTVSVAVTPSGKLDLGNYTISGSGASYSPVGNYNSTYNRPSASGSLSGGCAVTLGSNTVQVRSISNIPIGAAVTSTSHPTLFPAGTIVLSYNGSGNYFVSKAATATVDSTNTPELSLTFTAAGSTTVTSNNSGLDGSLLAFTSVNSVSGANYIFNTATSTPFNAITASPVNVGGITVNANTTLNKAIVNLSGTLNLNSGILTIPTGDSLRINSGNEILGAPFSNTKFIDTKVDAGTGALGVLDIEYFSTPRLFPVGTNGNYLPVTIAPDSTSGFAVTAFNGATQNGLPNGTVIDAAQKDSSVDASYLVTRMFPNNENTHNATLTVNYPASLMGTSFASLMGQVGISHYNGATWDAVTGSGSSVSLMATGIFSSFSPFLVTKNVNVVLPVKFGSITAAVVGQKEVKINWTIFSEINIESYVVERSVDGIHFTAIGTVKASNNTAYGFLDMTPQSGINFYRIASIEKGTFVKQYSNVVKISINSVNAGLSIYPNPVKGGRLNFQLSGLKPGKIALSLYNNMGQSVYTTMVNYTGGVMSQTIQLASVLLSGNYDVLVTDGTSALKQKVMILQ